MLPAATYARIGPKILPVILAAGGATVAGRSLSQISREPVRAKAFQAQPVAVEPRSPYFEKVLESVFA
ncbi:hypothetical protein F66182_2279 [Fusarium sp. NRRL 66182]|nr:hypothetical protein F66182_2279 [Fusarium sp. NRRL 66182]